MWNMNYDFILPRLQKVNKKYITLNIKDVFVRTLDICIDTNVPTIHLLNIYC